MGTDNLFHKGRERTARKLKRGKARRSPYDYALIVCEGEKTEPNYLKALRYDLKLHSANIVISGESGSDPMSVVRYAKKLYKQEPDYDRVFCVFDKD